MIERNVTHISASPAGSPTVADTSLRENVATVLLFIFFIFSMTILSALFGSVGRAQSAAMANDPATLAASADGKGGNQKIIYSGQFLFETTRSADESTEASYAGVYDLTAAATHKKLGLTATASASYSRQYTFQNDDGTDGNFDNPSLVITKSFRNGKSYNFDAIDSISVSLNTTLGANRESARRTLLWTNGTTLKLTKQLGPFFLRQAFAYTHSFFDKEIRDNGTINAPDSMKAVSMVYYSINDMLSVGGSFTYAHAISFQGVGRGSTLAAASVDYAFTDKIIASIGVLSERSTMEPDGVTNRVRVYAPEAAQYFVDLVLLM